MTQCSHCGEDKPSVKARDVGDSKMMMCSSCSAGIQRRRPKYAK